MCVNFHYQVCSYREQLPGKRDNRPRNSVRVTGCERNIYFRLSGSIRITLFQLVFQKLMYIFLCYYFYFTLCQYYKINDFKQIRCLVQRR